MSHLKSALLLCAAMLLGGCSEKPPKSTPTDSWVGICIDADGDGYGLACDNGADCDDEDPTAHDDCSACSVAREGCACEPGTAPVSCTEAASVDGAGSLLCREGERYCRDGSWTACEGLRTFAAPSPAEFNQLRGRAVIQPDASTTCSPCNPDCFHVADDFSRLDAGPDASLRASPGGGITLGSTTVYVDAGSAASGDAGLLDDSLQTCVPGSAPDRDCDGIRDTLDPYPDAKPFTSSHNTIFMNLAPGQTSASSFDINFSLRTADIYFYLDMTRSMEDERDNLIASLTAGSFLPANVAGTDCADHNLDGQPDNFLKSQGVAGNIYCLIRDSQLGAGWFRDIPFVGPYAGANLAAPYVAPSDFIMYENRQDITSDIASVLTSLQGFETRGNYNAPEGSMQGLYAIATGSEIYAGWDRPGIPSRNDCGSGKWGYPCFRDGALPIIVHITDAPLQNGPAPASNKLANITTRRCSSTSTSAYGHPVNYDSSVLSGVKPGTGGTYYHLTSSAETFATAQDVGTVDNAFVTYVGDTTRMSSDLSYANTGSCPSVSAWDASSQQAGDAVFKFKLTTPKTTTISTRGTHFDASLLLMKASAALTGQQSAVASNNGSLASALNLGTLSAGKRNFIKADTVGFDGSYPREGMEVAAAAGCFAGAAADDVQGASVVKFQLAANANLRFSSTGTSDAVTALYASAPIAATTRDLSTLACGGASGNCNDKQGQFNVGDLAGNYVHLIRGDTSSANLTAGYSAAALLVAGCSNSYDASKDAVVDFSISKTTAVRIESSGSGSSMGASFSHGLALMARPSLGLPLTRSVSGNGTQATAASITEADLNSVSAGVWVQYAGSSASDTATYEQADVGGSTANVCHNNRTGGASADRDVVFKFVLTTPQTYEFDTTPTLATSGYQTWLSLHKDAIDTSSTLTVSNAAELDSAQGQAAATNEQGGVDSRRVTLTNGQMDVRDRSFAPSVMGSNCGSSSNSALGGRDAVFKFRANTTGSVRIRTVGQNGTGTPGFDSYLAVFRGSISGANLVSGSCPTPWLLDLNANNQSGNGWDKTVNVTAGNDYYVVVKEWAFATSMSATSGRFGLIIEDTRAAGLFLGCDAGSASNTQYSKLSATLTAGTYYLVIKGTGAAGNNTFQLNVRKPATTGAQFVGCSNDASGRASIERTLAPGDYSVVIKGQRAGSCNFFGICSYTSSQGAYNLTLRDLAAAPKPLACLNSAKGQTSFVQSALPAQSAGQPIDYYLVTRGITEDGSFDLAIEDTSLAALAPTACDDNGAPAVGVVPSCYDSSIEGSDYGQIKVTNLAAGDYFVVLKGHTSADRGAFQLSIGNNESPPATSTMNARSWLGPAGDGVGGVRAALLSRGVRVLTVNSSADAYLDEQAKKLSRDTLALDANGNALSFQIASDGTGLGAAVVQAVTDLVGTLSMDLGVQLLESPDNPTPNFGFTVEALHVGTNSCASVADRDGDPAHLPDTHVACRPGSIPRFKVAFTNPSGGGAVPPNPADPGGGYNMKLQLIGDGKFVVDEIPVYIVPSALAHSPPVPVTQYATNASYQQTVITDCGGTQAPRWDGLDFNATIPAGTNVEFQICSGQTSAEVGGCALQPLAVVTSGAACVSSTTCPNGYCSASGLCYYVAGTACTSNAACGKNGVCVSNTCRYTNTPVALPPVLKAGQQGQRNMRVQVTLRANSARTAAPTVQDYRLLYTCTAQE